jgi:hypothetical protein
VATLVTERTVCGPGAAEHADGLLDGLDALAGRPPRSTHPGDRVPEGAGSEPELESSLAQEVQAGRRLGHHRRRPQREVRDGREYPVRDVLASRWPISTHVSRKRRW